ncbi:MAG: PspC domain-containing protein [Bacteroidales bacterium]|nr:PspC domain-containing protein [Bacteroidales bacterium]
MNRGEKLSIGGYAFNLEEDAAKSLTEYIESLRKSYAGAPDAAEIMEAFEDRICEMLLENHPADSVVSPADIDAIKAALGAPEAIVNAAAEEDPGTGNGAKTAETPEKPLWWRNEGKKRIFRPKAGRVIGGVCSGLANYFGIDVTVLRIVWALMLCVGIFFDSFGIFSGISGFALLSYIILWICIPASSESQEMLYAKNHDDGERSRTLYVIGRILKVCLGLFFILMGVSGLAAGVIGICGIGFIGLSSEASEIINQVLEVLPGLTNMVALKVVAILLILCYFIPCLILLYEGLKLCFGFRSPSWHPGLVMTILWIFTVIALCIVAGMSVLPAFTS